MHTALTIAGSDSGGGAGIQADLKTFLAHDVYGMSVVTAITAQNTQAVTAVHGVPVDVVLAQLAAVFDDLPVDAMKTGMLADPAMIDAVARFLHDHPNVPLVVDPVMVTTSGFDLVADVAVEAIVAHLFPLATVITPNAHEAARLLGRPVNTVAAARDAARELAELGPRAVLVKGGHLDDATEAVDVLWDGAAVHEFALPRLETTSTHGTGCSTAAALAANLSRGLPLVEAVDRAKAYVHGAIANAAPLGHGSGPVDHGWWLERPG